MQEARKIGLERMVEKRSFRCWTRLDDTLETIASYSMLPSLSHIANELDAKVHKVALSVTEVVYTTQVVYIPVLINPSSRFDS